jgi:hypothetical protein
MQAQIDDLPINRARISSNRVTSLAAADLGAVLAIPCHRQNLLIDRDRNVDCHAHGFC